MLRRYGMLNRYVVARETNSVDALIPEVWAQESLMLLWQKMTIARLVHTDFTKDVARFGDVVNTRRPSKYTANRKVTADDVSPQNSTVTNVQVPLDQHIYTSFFIRDGEETLSMKSLIDYFLEPAVMSIAQAIDQVLIGQLYSFLSNSVGRLGTAVDKATLIAAREKMTNNLAPLEGRNLLVTPNTEGSLLNISEFVNAEKIGDDGSTLRSGSLGNRFGFNIYTAQGMPSLGTPASGAVVLGALSADEAAGQTEISVDGFSAAIPDGSWLTVAGDDTPQLVTGSTGGATPSAINISPGLVRACLNNAVVTLYKPAAVNLGAGYAAGYNKEMTIDGISVAPKVGQMVSVGTTSLATATKYGVISSLNASATKMMLNRSLEATIANDGALNLGPYGDYNFAFHRNAVALVSRPLVQPMAGAGVRSAVADANGVGIRVTMGYDMYKQGHLVTLDLLCGTKVLDTDLGCVIFG